MMARSNLTEAGWEEPINDSPIDTPDGWMFGGVEHTGGNIYCRIWRTYDYRDESDPEPGDVEYEVIYGSEFRGVDLQRYVADDDGLLAFDGVVESRECDTQTDANCAEKARELMEQADELIDAPKA